MMLFAFPACGGFFADSGFSAGAAVAEPFRSEYSAAAPIPDCD
jgi:hypothetical protein